MKGVLLAFPQAVSDLDPSRLLTDLQEVYVGRASRGLEVQSQGFRGRQSDCHE